MSFERSVMPWWVEREGRWDFLFVVFTLEQLCQAVFWFQVSSEAELRGEVPCQGVSRPHPASIISTPE